MKKTPHFLIYGDGEFLSFHSKNSRLHKKENLFLGLKFVPANLGAPVLREVVKRALIKNIAEKSWKKPCF